jgi:LysM repeat protein
MFPSEINKKITLDETSDGTVKSTYTFSYNPTEVSIRSALLNVKSNFLRNDRAVIRPTQLDSRTITGRGKFLDDYKEKITAFDYYKSLESFQAKKQPLLFTHEKYGNFFIIIQELGLQNTGSHNSVIFDFSFVETRIVNTATGFERDDNGDGIPNLEEEQQTIGFTDYIVISGDSLWKIALRFYNKGSLWPKIYEYNKDVIGDNPNLIQIGQVLKIPDVSASSGVAGGGTPQVFDLTSIANADKAEQAFETYKTVQGLQNVSDAALNPLITSWNQVFGTINPIEKLNVGKLLGPPL